MIANAAFLAAMVLLLVLFAMLGPLAFLAPYKRFILMQYGSILLGAGLVLVVNLFALFYLLGRAIFLKDTGRKLAHVEKQLRTGDTIVRDLSERLAEGD